MPPLRFFSSLLCATLPIAALADAPAVNALECSISVTQARRNLEARGYVIAAGATSIAFATDFRFSDRDSERRLLGSLAVERARAYRVEATREGIRFVPRQRERVVAPEVLGRRSDDLREHDFPLAQAASPTIDDLRSEVCGNTPSAAAGESDDTLRYLDERCRAGDERACRLRAPR